MRNMTFAASAGIDCEGRGAYGGLTVSRSRTLRKVLLLWAVAGVMFFGGGLTVQAEPATPESPQCTVSDKTVTCTGNLSEGVKVDGGEGAEAGTYTKLVVNNLNTNIVPATWTNGIGFTSDSDIDITVNTGGHSITAEYLPTFGIDAIAGVFAHSKEGGNITVKMTGTIASEGGNSDGIFARSQGVGSEDDGFVDITANGNITTNGHNSQGIAANSTGKGAVKVDMTGNITTDGTLGIGIYADTDGSVEVYTDGAILTKGSNSAGISAGSNGGNVTVNVTGTITTERGSSEGIAASINSGGNMEVIVNKGAVIKTLGNASQGISVVGTGIGNEDMEIGVDVKGAVIETSGNSNSSGIFAEASNGTSSDPAIAEENIIDITIDMTGDIKTTGKGDNNYGILARSPGDSDITVGVNGDITTEGTQSYGIFAQVQNAGAVDITVNGDITTLGDSSDGIVAEVGVGDGDVLINVTGDILAKGLSSSAIDTSVADGEIKITLHGGSLISEQTFGVEFGNSTIGKVNSLTISESAAVTISGGNGIDVMGGSGNETINNYGTLTALGAIDLGEGDNSFNNKAGATFNSGTFVTLSHEGDTDDTFRNAGNLSPGGADLVQITEISGDFQNAIRETGSGTLIGGIYTVTLAPESNDRLKVTGYATLDGTVRVVGAYAGAYTILESQQISGVTEFDGVMDTLFMDYELSYEDGSDIDIILDHVVLTSTRRKDVSFLQFAETANQQSMANALDSLDGSNVSNSVIQAVRSLTDPQQLPEALDAVSGEVHASLKGALMDTGQGSVAAISRRLGARFGDGGPWVAGYGSRGDTDAGSGTARMDTDLSGFVLGVDRALGERWRFGILGGHSQTDVTQRARLSSASVDTWSAGLYGGVEAGASSIRAGAIYNRHTINAKRTVHFTNFPAQRVSADYDAKSWQVFAEAGHKVQAGDLMLESFAGVSHTSLDTDGFSEIGGDETLTAASDTGDATFTTLGLRAAMELKDRVHAHGMAGWRHAFGDTDPSSNVRLGGNTIASKVMGAAIAEDALVTELGLEAELLGQAVFGVVYKGRYGDGVSDHGLNAGLRVMF